MLKWGLGDMWGYEGTYRDMYGYRGQYRGMPIDVDC